MNSNNGRKELLWQRSQSSD